MCGGQAVSLGCVELVVLEVCSQDKSDVDKSTCIGARRSGSTLVIDKTESESEVR